MKNTTLNKTIITATLGLLMLLIASPSPASTLDDPATEKLIREDFQRRRACLVDRTKKCDLGMGAPNAHAALLAKNQCPAGGGSPETLTLPATGGYSDLENTALYCRKMKAYWVLTRHGAFVGTAKSLFGPFDPFAIGTRQESPKQRMPLENKREQPGMKPSGKSGKPLNLNNPSGMRKIPAPAVRPPLPSGMINAPSSPMQPIQAIRARPMRPSPLSRTMVPERMRPIRNSPASSPAQRGMRPDIMMRRSAQERPRMLRPTLPPAPTEAEGEDK